MEKNNIKNAIVSFVCPLRLEGKTIYGFIFNKETKSSIDDYISYLTAAEEFIRNGGKLKDGKDTWSFGEYSIKVNSGLWNLIGCLYFNETLYLLDFFDEPLIYNSNEVDEDCFIIDTSLLGRYTEPKYQKKKVSYVEEDEEGE